MAAAAAGNPRVDVVYRDERMPWHVLAADGATVKLDGLDPRATERFSATDLLTAMWGDRDFDVVPRQSAIEPEVARAAERALGGSPWRR